MKTDNNHNIILFLSTYPPRECGIATFTQDLAQAMNKRFNPVTKSKILAINENETSFYNYPEIVHCQIAGDELKDYAGLAEDINKNDNIKIINIQHEFGIFGGEMGDYLIPFFQVIEKPVITTFHSVLPEPQKHIKKLVNFIADHSSAIIVMNQRSAEILQEDYQILKNKIHLIPHGIPDTTFDSSAELKKKFHLEGKTVLSTFGLLSPGKGIEYAIRALPEVIRQHPEIVYLVLGETHPMHRKLHGEKYRDFLNGEVERLQLKDNVKFYPKYLSLEEIIEYLKATDIYISTPLELTQSVSGTLSYALGCGRPAISTATEYAKYIIDENTGILVKSKSPRAISLAILKIISDGPALLRMSKNAYADTRKMIWPNVAASYFDVYKRFAKIDSEEKKFPILKLDHLVRMTNNFGLVQHATYEKPNLKFGYSTDDNARALIFLSEYNKYFPDNIALDLIKKYLKFIECVQTKDGTLSNIVNKKKRPDRTKTDDVQGRGIWALGYILSQDNLPQEIIKPAKKIFKKLLRTLKFIKAPRARAFAIIGLYYHLKRLPRRLLHRSLYKTFIKFSDAQIKFYRESSTDDWHWFEDNLTYSNSKLSECLFYAYDLTKNKKYLDVAQKSLKFLSQITFENGQYTPIGQNGWFHKSNHRSYFDQQPEDTASMVQTKIIAYKITGHKHHLKDAAMAFQWFLGKNYLKQMVYNEVTGGCHDGIGQYSLNMNQGAESTLSYLMARLEFEDPKIKAGMEKI